VSCDGFTQTGYTRIYAVRASGPSGWPGYRSVLLGLAPAAYAQLQLQIVVPLRNKASDTVEVIRWMRRKHSS